jgi:hypothetical protein
MKRILFTLIVTLALAGSAYAQPAHLIRTGATLAWQASSGDHGSMKVAIVSGQYFEIDQTNENNKAAGVQTLYGAILDRGRKIVLLNVGNWKEVWEGTPSGDSISGTITAGSANFTFTISAGATGGQFSTAPFLPGKILKWKTNAAGGQNGHFRVTDANGPTFTLEQKNFNNVAAGIVKMDGEVKHGKIYIYNRQWNETWIGTVANGVVSGKINNRHAFQIEE